MTCIVAIEHDGKVFMGGDSGVFAGYEIVELGKKVFMLGNMIVGCTGHSRFSQIIEYNLSLPEKVEGEDDMRYLVARFVPAVRECLKQHGYTRVENNIESTDDLMLIGCNGRIYEIYSDFSVIKPPFGFAAIGCGADYALGNLGGIDIKHLDQDAVTSVIEIALEISAKFSAGVEPPFYVLSR